jgi:hypothetical protein
VEVELVLVTFMEILDWLIAQGQTKEAQIAEKWFTTREVIAYMVCHGLYEAFIEHLLFFGANCPEQLRSMPIALGSSFADGLGHRLYPYMSGGCEPFLGSTADDDCWDFTCCFLAVRQ